MAGRIGGRVALVAAVLAMGCVLLFVTSFPAMCPMRLLLHTPCPSCGLTRATRLAVAGDFAGATHMHPLWFLALPFVGVLGFWQLGYYLLHGRTARMGRGVSSVGYVILGLLITVWIARFFGAFGGPCPI